MTELSGSIDLERLAEDIFTRRFVTLLLDQVEQELHQSQRRISEDKKDKA